MIEEKKTDEVFINGSEWLRADLHLHTNEDAEFRYEGDANYYHSSYIDKLVEQDIKIAAITNHNKFKLDEFKHLRKIAKKRQIYLLPGIELSVGDGSNGIHCLVIFDAEEWLANGEDCINQFLSATFAGKSNYENENGRSNHSLKQTIDKLNSFNKNYFIVMAHVEQRSGFYNELDGGRILEFGKDPNFEKAVLAFQKVRTRDKIENLKLWFNGKLPAFIEGSDPKSIDEIGKGNKTYFKIGAYNFEAIKYALIDKDYRISEDQKSPTNGFVKSISFRGGKLNGKTIYLNHAMNNLIGIRGSGKSSVLEAVRYALDIELNEKEHIDFKYKTKLINALVGSGGVVSCVLVDENKNEYTTEKVFGDPKSKIYKNGEYQMGLKPDAIVKRPLYFGQKDLSQIGDDISTEEFISKLIGDKLMANNLRIDDKNQEIIHLISEIEKIDAKLVRKEEFEAKEAELKLKIKAYKDNKIDEKLEKQITYNKDVNFITRLGAFEERIIESLVELLEEYRNRFDSFKNYTSKHNQDAINNSISLLERFEVSFYELFSIADKLIAEKKNLDVFEKDFLKSFEELKEEFAQKKRDLDLSDIKADDYVKYNKELDTTRSQLQELEKLAKKRADLNLSLQLGLNDLQQLWHNEFEIVRSEIDSINADQSIVDVEGRAIPKIEITVEFKMNKELFVDYLKPLLKGSNLRENVIQSIVDEYPDLITVYNDISSKSGKIMTILSDSQMYAFKEYLNKNLGAFLTFKTPNKFDIKYRGKPLIEHSLGQRASALIIFMLTLNDNDVIIIDQPEDDLDNQTIYNDVLKLLRNMKNSTQFIFATHNPNIPVLGDCEQVITCHYKTNEIDINFGSIDNATTRKDIVNIMEGGEEAFNNRKRIYDLWTQ